MNRLPVVVPRPDQTEVMYEMSCIGQNVVG